MLSIAYDAKGDAGKDEFLKDFRSRMLLTYRKSLQPVLALADGDHISSDTGWGCMLRVTQMMLAQCFLSILLGREWRFDENTDLADGSSYLAVASCFLDVPTASFSLHRFVLTGQQLLGKKPSSWFGPTSAAQVSARLFSDAATEESSPSFVRRTACVVSEDGAIYRDLVLEQFESGKDAVILLVCRRLGLDYFNLDDYREGVESCFQLPEFQGLASGNSASSAHFFVATHGDSLIFLDPHSTQPALNSMEDIRASLGLRPERPYPLLWSRLNPSICMSFLVRSKEEFNLLCARLAEGPRSHVFEVLDRKPCYEGRLEEDAEDGDMVLLH